MSFRLGIPWQVALQQSLPPLSQPEPLCNDKEWSVEQFSADGTCLTDSVSQNSPQSTKFVFAKLAQSHAQTAQLKTQPKLLNPLNRRKSHF
jgi:hypothetical protein